MPLIILLVIFFVLSNISKKTAQQKNTENEYPNQKSNPAFDFDGYEEGEGMESMPEESLNTETESSLHTVKPFTESTHSHLETSLTGFTPCITTDDESPLQEQEVMQEKPANTLALNFDAKNIASGIFYAEILGKPKSLRR